MYEQAYGEEITQELAEQWVKGMRSEHFTGQRFTMEQTTDCGNKLNIEWHDCPKCHFYVAMNMMFHDYYETAMVYDKVDDVMWFAHHARDFLHDMDAKDNKLFNYYFSVVV